MDTSFASHYDPGTSTLELIGTFGPDEWTQVTDEIERAFRRTACWLTIDLTRAAGVSAHSVGHLVHLCNSRYPGTIVRVPRARRAIA